MQQRKTGQSSYFRHKKRPYEYGPRVREWERLVKTGRVAEAMSYGPPIKREEYGL